MPRAKAEFRGKQVTVYLKADRLAFLDSINPITTAAIHQLIDQSLSKPTHPQPTQKRMGIRPKSCGHISREPGCIECRRIALGIA